MFCCCRQQNTQPHYSCCNGDYLYSRRGRFLLLKSICQNLCRNTSIKRLIHIEGFSAKPSQIYNITSNAIVSIIMLKRLITSASCNCNCTLRTASYEEYLLIKYCNRVDNILFVFYTDFCWRKLTFHEAKGGAWL